MAGNNGPDVRRKTGPTDSAAATLRSRCEKPAAKQLVKYCKKVRLSVPAYGQGAGSHFTMKSLNSDDANRP